MLIRHRGITHERFDDAPFVGALICAMKCTFKCKDCFNTELKNEKLQKEEASEIVHRILSNPMNEGIIFGGLEWSNQPIELIELAREASYAGLQVMIYTGCDEGEFHDIIGRACVKHSGLYDALQSQMLTGGDEGLYPYLGAMILDSYIKGEYYIKFGRYDNKKKTDEVTHFGVRLASSNQKVHKYTKEEIVDDSNDAVVNGDC